MCEVEISISDRLQSPTRNRHVGCEMQYVIAVIQYAEYDACAGFTF